MFTLFKIYLNLSKDSINKCSKASRGWNLIMDVEKGVWSRDLTTPGNQ